MFSQLLCHYIPIFPLTFSGNAGAHVPAAASDQSEFASGEEAIVIGRERDASDNVEEFPE